jgi:hypothetical protein
MQKRRMFYTEPEINEEIHIGKIKTFTTPSTTDHLLFNSCFNISNFIQEIKEDNNIKTKQQPYCHRCNNGIIIEKTDEFINKRYGITSDYYGTCDKCNIIGQLSLIEIQNYIHYQNNPHLYYNSH